MKKKTKKKKKGAGLKREGHIPTLQDKADAAEMLRILHNLRYLFVKK